MAYYYESFFPPPPAGPCFCFVFAVLMMIIGTKRFLFSKSPTVTNKIAQRRMHLLSRKSHGKEHTLLMLLLDQGLVCRPDYLFLYM